MASENEVQEMREWMERCAGLDEAVRPAGQGDVAAAADEVLLHFESAEDAEAAYAFLIGEGTGVKFLDPGEVVLRVIEGWDQCTLGFAPHVRYLKPEIIAAVVEAFADQIEESAVDELHRELREDVQALVEFNAYHDKQGNFSSKEGLKRAKAGSFSQGKRKNKVSPKGKKALKLVATKLPCGRDARDRGKNQRCWDGAKLAWSGQVMTRALKKWRGKAEALTVDDRFLLERAARALDARVAVMGMEESKNNLLKNKKYDTLIRFRKISIPVDVAGAVRYGKAREYVSRVFPDMSMAEHQNIVSQMDAMIPKLEKKYNAEAEAAAQETWGRPLRFSDYKISCIYSDEFSEERKDAMRKLCVDIQRAKDIRNLHANARVKKQVKESDDVSGGKLGIVHRVLKKFGSWNKEGIGREIDFSIVAKSQVDAERIKDDVATEIDNNRRTLGIKMRGARHPLDGGNRDDVVFVPADEKSDDGFIHIMVVGRTVIVSTVFW